jgi:hypothetical protein
MYDVVAPRYSAIRPRADTARNIVNIQHGQVLLDDDGVGFPSL